MTNFFISSCQDHYDLFVDGKLELSSPDLNEVIDELTNYASENGLLETDDRIELLKDLKALREQIDKLEILTKTLMNDNLRLSKELEYYKKKALAKR